MSAATATPRRRDAAETRRLLLGAARRRFAADGYTATTVREIADDAGVNVALINRYFSSKEGLFEACLLGAADEIGRTVDDQPALDRAPRSIARQLAGQQHETLSQLLLLLLRRSGNERADEIRTTVLRTYAQRLAEVAGWSPGDPDDLLLRAQMVLAAAFGVAALRSNAALTPLSSATEDDLTGPLTDLIAALLPQR